MIISTLELSLAVVTIFLLIILLIILAYISRYKKKAKGVHFADQKEKEAVSIALQVENAALKQELQTLLECKSGLSKEEAKQIWLCKLKEIYQTELIEFTKFHKAELESHKRQLAADILVEAMENISEHTVNAKSLLDISLRDESIKGRIIGKEGRNKKAFEGLAGVDIIINENNSITVSSINPIRRQIAYLAMCKLINSRSIDILKMEKEYFRAKEEFENELVKIGQEALFKLGLNEIDQAAAFYIGRLQYRTSYGQNVLSHSIEAAQLAVNIARILDLDEEKAKRAAFFHDIGKSVDFEFNYDHVKSGIEIAQKLNLEAYIINAIASHHDDVKADNVYAALVKVVDTISAARKGARVDSSVEHFQRLKAIEETCARLHGVQQAFVLKSGRFLRVIVEPTIIDENQIELLALKVRELLLKQTETNKFNIEIQVIRESKFSLMTNFLPNI